MIYRLILIAIAIVLATAPTALSQTEKSSHNIGLSASIQDGQFDILLPVWFSNHLCIAPAVGLLWAEEGASDIRLAIVPRYFFYKEQFAPYIGARLGALIASPNEGESTTDLLIGLAGGGEYFLDEHFSFGVEAQLNLTLSDEFSARFGNPDKKTFNTAAAVFATVYF